MIESLALRRRRTMLGPNAHARPTVTPVQRSNGVSPNPNPRGVEGRDLLLWQGQRQARAKVDTHPFGLRGCTSLHASAWASNWLLPTMAAASLASIYGVIAAGVLLGCQLGARWCLASSLSCAST